MWVSEWPRSQVYPGFLAPILLSSGMRRGLSLIRDPIRADRDIRRLVGQQAQAFTAAALPLCRGI